MNYICIGKIVNTHGIKGEIRILSDFKYKDLIFVKNFKVYIGEDKQEEEINTYRRHKMFDMITLEGINNINDVLKYKGKKIYINRSDINIDGYLQEDLIGLDVYQKDKYIGKVTEIIKNHQNGILVIENKKNRNLVPNLDEFIKVKDNKIYIIEMEGLIDEN